MKKIIVLLLLNMLPSLYGYSSNMIQQCDSGYTQSCLALLWQAREENDKKSSLIYRQKLLHILDNACKKDYQTCLILAHVYEDKNDMTHITKVIQKNIENKKLPDLDSFNLAYIQESSHSNSDKQQSKQENTKNQSHTSQTNISQLRDSTVAANNQKVLGYYEKSIPLLESACYANDIRACLILSYFYEYGIPSGQNRPKAKRLKELALDITTRECMLGRNEICPIIDRYPEYRQEIIENIGALERKCNENDSIACFKVALYYTQHYYTGSHKLYDDEEDKTDFVKSARVLQKICHIEKRMCEETLLTHKNAKECLLHNDMNACANVEGSQKVEFLSLACESGNLESCYTLRILPKFEHTKRLIALLQKTCKGGIIEACIQLADMYYYGKRVNKNIKKALDFAQRACMWSIKNQSDGTYCYYAAMGYEKGEYVKRDLEKAIKFYHYACQTSQYDGSPCEHLAYLYETYRHDSQQAFSWYQKACNKENSPIMSCLKTAQAYYAGDRVKQNISKAIQIYEKLLSQNIQDKEKAYFELAKIYAQPQLYDQQTQSKQDNIFLNYAKSLFYQHKACEMQIGYCDSHIIDYPNLTQECKSGNYNACYQIAILLELFHSDSTYKQDIEKFGITLPFDSTFLRQYIDSTNDVKANQLKNSIASLYIESCKHHVLDACHKIYAYRDFINTHNEVLQELLCRYGDNTQETQVFCITRMQQALLNKEYKKVIEVLESLPYTNSVLLNMLVEAYFYTQSYQKVIDTYKIIYTNEFSSDYYYLGYLYEYGLGVKKDYSKALEIYKLSQTPLGYFGQARMLENGSGISSNINRAKELYMLACPLNVEKKEEIAVEACVRLGQIFQYNGDTKQSQKYYSKVCQMKYDSNQIACDN